MCFICIISFICVLVYFGTVLGANKILSNVICTVKNGVIKFEFPWQNRLRASDCAEEDDAH